MDYLRKKLKHAPYFTIWTYVLASYLPALKGVVLGTLPHLALLFLVTVVGSEAILGPSTLMAFWDDTPQSDPLWFSSWKGRIGMIYLWFALYLIQFSAGMMVPVPKSEEEELIVKTMREKYAEAFAEDDNPKIVNAKGRKIKWFKDGEEDSYLMSEEENPDQEEELGEEEKQEQEMQVLEPQELLEKYPDQSPISILKMKRTSQTFLLMLMVLSFGLILNLGYTDFYRRNYLLLVPLGCFIGRFVLTQTTSWSFCSSRPSPAKCCSQFRCCSSSSTAPP